ncbi:MFS transporter [Gordonia rubripertincta]|uniref:MFS transporter n=1 Tax=Gordonia rubripertincta TaxID=36822 RepID=A0AAW4G9F6_GORRU|nr:MFS transporter [Gordonia rubripertincta]MBM7279979.1 MFS transporter [Gordonia rubripertincta]
MVSRGNVDAVGVNAPSESVADPMRAAIQRRTVVLLCLVQVLGGVSMGGALALGAILGEELSGTESLAGLPTTVLTLGAAAAGLPLAALASARGRRPALATGLLVAAAGALIVALGVDRGWFPVMLAGMTALGSGTAVSLQARFAATDLASPETRGRNLSLVVWMTMVGAVVGPALVPLGAAVAGWVGMADLSGPFLLGAVGCLCAAAVLVIGLRPDPLIEANRGAPESTSRPSPAEGLSAIVQSPQARAALAAVVSAHAVMVGVMALTPVHMHHGGASVTLVGLSISAHIAGMYALSPIMGILADRVGRVPVILGGQAVLVVSCVAGFVFVDSQAGLVAALVLLGIGWSASTVAASTLLTDAVDTTRRAAAQGVSDTSMSLAGAGAGALAGVVVGAFGYAALVLGAGTIAVLTAAYVVVDGARGRRPAAMA